MARWFDHHLKGIDTGVGRDPAVRYYVMGANVWRTAKDWPVPATGRAYHLREGGLLTNALAASPERITFRADPEYPATIAGRAFPGAADGGAFERHPDVRLFTTAPLEAPVEWTGLVKAELRFSSDAPDTDLLVRLSDVYPDGRSILIADGIQRLRFRESWERETLMKPGEVYTVRFNIGWISQQFATGHRIRIAVSSSGADLYEPNPNTGLAFTSGVPAQTRVANNVLHEGSRILAPVLP
jgi:hypothetical protein